MQTGLMQTKYIRMSDGNMAIFSERTGVQHWMMARDYFPDVDVSDAGFVYWENGSFHVYGESKSLGRRSDPDAASDLTEALRDGRIKIISFPQDENFFASTQGTGVTASDASELVAARII